jgi:hypothetical protein
MHAKPAKDHLKMIRVAAIKQTNTTNTTNVNPVKVSQPVFKQMAPPPPNNPKTHQIHKIYQEPKPTRLPQPPPEPHIVVEPVKVKRTFSFKKQTKAKADKFDEHGKSRSIIAFFHSNSNTPKIGPKSTKTSNELQAVMQSAKEEPCEALHQEQGDW